MKKRLWLILTLGLALLVTGLTGCNTTSPGNVTVSGSLFNNQSTGIWVSGQGKVTITPDVAILSLGVEAQATTVEEAQSQVTTSMNAVVSALNKGGVADKDIKTQGYNIQRLTRYDSNTQQQITIGYMVTNTVSAKVRTIANTGGIIDDVAMAGGDNTRINSISFTVDNPTSYESQARELAIADAKAKAKHMAELAGVKLGKATYIVESGGATPIKTIPGDTAAPSLPSPEPAPISPGETDITLTVQITFSIE